LLDVGVLIRPHPANASQWKDFDLSGLPQVALWRLRDTEPATKRAKDEFFDTIRHCNVVVGLNSTALIESAIIGRPVLTWLTPDYEASQNGTMHFDLIAGPNGMLIVGHSWEEHLGQLVAALRDEDLDGDRRRRFIASFVRPRGVQLRATDVLADVLEQAAAAPAPAPARSLGASVLRVLLTPIVHWPMNPYDKARLRARRRDESRKPGRSPRRMLEKKIARMKKRRRALRKRLRRHEQLSWLILLRLLTSDDDPRGRLLRSDLPMASNELRASLEKGRPRSRHAPK
jgi:hypothetical protein